MGWMGWFAFSFRDINMKRTQKISYSANHHHHDNYGKWTSVFVIRLQECVTIVAVGVAIGVIILTLMLSRYHVDPAILSARPVQIQKKKVPSMIWETKNNNNNSISSIPVWMEEYFEWHRKQVQGLNEKSYKDHKYLILRCLDIDSTCGGVSDRLKSIPLLIKLASRSQRIFLIHWQRPVFLEEFLIPPLGGLNWTCPTWLLPYMRMLGSQLYTQVTTLENAVHQPDMMIMARLQDQHGGSELYNRDESVPRAFRTVFRDLWDVLFEPSPPVLFVINQRFRLLQLIPNQYVGAHVRVNYGSNMLLPEQRESMAMNAVRCASRIRVGSSIPIYFTSDSFQALCVVQNYSRQHHLESLVLFPPSSLSSATSLPLSSNKKGVDRHLQPLHLDKASSRVPMDYYDIFVDLYMFYHASCISHGQGGFGRLAVLLSNNSSCFFTYIRQSRMIQCLWDER